MKHSHHVAPGIYVCLPVSSSLPLPQTYFASFPTCEPRICSSVDPHQGAGPETHLHAHAGVRILFQPIEELCSRLLRLMNVPTSRKSCGFFRDSLPPFLRPKLKALSSNSADYLPPFLTKAGKPYFRGRYSSMNSFMDLTFPPLLASISS